MPAFASGFLQSHLDAVLAGLCVSVVFLLLLTVVLLSKLARLTRVYARLTRGTSGGNMEERLLVYMDTAEETAARQAALEGRVDALAARQRHCLQNVGVVRFDAFEEVGGEQSFAAILTDAEGSGIALSSIFSRTDNRVYAKAIRRGRAALPLTTEEQRALAAAQREDGDLVGERR